MLSPDQLIHIGTIVKVHGLHGELLANITDAVFDEVQRCPYLVCCLDGIFVPFFLQSYRFRSTSSVLLTFDDVDTQEKATTFCGLDLYFDRRCFTKAEAKAYDEAAEEQHGYIGYSIIDQTAGPIGTIIDIDDQTANVLFLVDHDGEELMIPAADDLVVSIDDDARVIVMDLPLGLIDLSQAEVSEPD